VFWIGVKADLTRRWKVGKAQGMTPGGDRLELPDFSVLETAMKFVGNDLTGVNLRAHFSTLLHRKPWY